MTISELSPHSWDGGLLTGDRPVRYVYMDEAGTSANEPVSIVVGLIVHADEHVMLAEAAVREVLGAVPDQFRKDFIFHATEVWGSAKYRDVWSMADRLALMKRMMALPSRIGLPVSLGLVRRDWDFDPPPPLTKAQFDHLQAFHYCVGRADKWIRDNAGLREVATIVAEDVPEMRQFLRVVPQMLREYPMTIPVNGVKPTVAELEAGYVTPETEQRVTRIRQPVHFVNKQDDPLLQLADACAFGFRRFFSGQTFGEDFVRAILRGKMPRLEDFSGPTSAITFDLAKALVEEDERQQAIGKRTAQAIMDALGLDPETLKSLRELHAKQPPPEEGK